MPKKPKEKEDELELQVAEEPKRETFVTRWFRDSVQDNQDDIRTVCELTARSAQQQFMMNTKSANYEVFAVIYFATFLAILEFLRECQSQYKRYSIEICNSINIGYKNNDDENNEKLGNFMPVMEYIGVNMNLVNSNTNVGVDTTTTNFLSWKTLNSKKNIEHYKKIQEAAYGKLLNDFRVDMKTSEGVIPLFCIFMDNINNVLRLKHREADGTKVSEISMNVMGLYDAFYSFDDEAGKECIEYAPNPLFKLSLKNDSLAGS